MDNQSCHRKNNNENALEKNGLQNGNATPIEANKTCKCHSSNGLHHYNCVPKHLQFNRFVHTGYRAELSTWDCLKSLFYLHNESFNVYSHGKYKNMSFYMECVRNLNNRSSASNKHSKFDYTANRASFDTLIKFGVKNDLVNNLNLYYRI